ncbi:hypothetical protein H312_00726 [Anncaliia algerae PRA339]|uniref:Uncharacterized protein n=1 Tax=Anncaliia algerae PRA339 TaxID=1288291 RepID=A0A059F3Z5_9MICR|nr:hypothetical protein H312_00726 [Anncaliia algerae PRA339]
MQTSDDFEDMLTRKSNEVLIIYMMNNNNLLKKENICQSCGQYMKLVKHNLTKDNFCWRCTNSKGSVYKRRASIREGRFFEDLNVNSYMILKSLLDGARGLPSFQL